MVDLSSLNPQQLEAVKAIYGPYASSQERVRKNESVDEQDCLYA